MKHYVLTRAAYGTSWPEEANRRRLDLMRGVTARSLVAQTAEFQWLVLLDRADPLLRERMALLRAADALPLYIDSRDRQAARKKIAYLGYWADWAGTMDCGAGMLTTRLDDDDALAPDALERIQRAAEASDGRRCVWMLPEGIRVNDGRYSRVRHETNAWATLQSPPGDSRTVYGHSHKNVAQYARVRMVDDEIGWLWVRHEDAISRHRIADDPLTDEVRQRFPVDWNVIER